MNKAALGLLLAITLASPLALADAKAACLDAAKKGQRARDTHQLVEAREQFRVCGAAVCPKVVQHDCAEWLVAVEAALPSVVLGAKTAAGADLVDVRVSMDGQPLATRLDGQALPMNAGPHTFRFEAESGAAEVQVVVKEGAKNQPVQVVIGLPVAPAPPAASPPAPAARAAPAEPSPTPASTPLRTVGWALAIAGASGLVVGASFGVAALVDKGRAHCVDDACDPGTSSGIKTTALVSDVGWIAGGVLLAGGGLLLLLPSRSSAPGREGARAWNVAPVFFGTGGGAILGATFR